jgi:hypothetical protein
MMDGEGFEGRHAPETTAPPIASNGSGNKTSKRAKTLHLTSTARAGDAEFT